MSALGWKVSAVFMKLDIWHLHKDKYYKEFMLVPIFKHIYDRENHLIIYEYVYLKSIKF